MGVWCIWPSVFKNGTVIGTSDLGNGEYGFKDYSPYKPPQDDIGVRQLGQFSLLDYMMCTLKTLSRLPAPKAVLAHS